MKFRNMLAATAATSMIVSPAMAADLSLAHDRGARTSSAIAGLYVGVPLGARRAKPKAGLRVQMRHDYRSPTAPGAALFSSDAAELRLMGEKKPTLFVGGQAVTGEQARQRQQLIGPIGTVVTVAFVAAAVVGGIVIWRAIDDSGEE